MCVGSLLIVYSIRWSEQVPDKQYAKKDGKPSLIVENNDNPYDSIGIIHNKDLDHIITKNPTQSSTATQMINWVDEYYEQKGWGDKFDTVTDNEEAINQANDITSVTYNSLYDSINNWEVSGKISSTVKPYYIDVADALDNFDSTKSDGYNNVTNTIINIESDLQNDGTVSDEEKEKFLKMSTVARHSSYYWFDQIYNNGDWVDGDVPYFKQLPTWASADISGVVFSFYNGVAQTGALFGWGGVALFVGGYAAVCSATAYLNS